MMREWYVLGAGGAAKAIEWKDIEALLENRRAGDGELQTPADAYVYNAWVRRCVDLRAYAISSIPYEVVRRGTDDIVSFPPLAPLLADTERWLSLMGAAYWVKAGTRLRPSFRILNPLTVRVITDPANGIVAFEQSVGAERIRFDPERIVYFRLFHPRDDLGPGVPPALTALTPARLAVSANQWAAAFFERSAIPPIILSTEIPLSEDDRALIRSTWERLTSGLRNAWRAMVLGGGVKPIVVGAPVKDVAMPELLEQVRHQIAVAFGIPQTLLEDAANYATARQHWVSFWTETIIPEALLMEHTLNEQLFYALGLEMRFLFNQIEALQQDEAEKAQAVTQLVQAGIMTVDEAREQMGLQEPTASAEPMDLSEAKATLADLQRWRQKVKRFGAEVKFESTDIPDALQEFIGRRLRDGVDDAFSFMRMLKVYADAIKVEPDRAAEAELRKRILDVFRGRLEAVLSSPESAVDALLGMDNDLRAAVQPVLVKVVEDAVIAESLAVGVYPDVAAVNAAALAWASSYTYDLVTGLMETTRKVVSDAIRAFLSTPGMTVKDLEDMLAPAFGPVRAEMIAITEVTRAMAQATLIYQQLLKEWGLEMVRVWHTSNDEHVCPICEPNNGKPEGAWTVPDGPPAHPRCRCWTTLELRRGKAGRKS